MLALLGVIVMLGAYGLVAYTAFNQGQDKNREWAEATRSAEIQKQIRLAATDVWVGRHELAMQRLAFVLTETPNYPPVQATYQAAQVTYQASLASPTPTSTPTPSPTVTPTPTTDPEDTFVEAQAAFEQGNWESTISKLRFLQVIDPDYNLEAVEQMLYTAYLSYGTELLESDRMEEGLFYLEGAEDLGPIPADIDEERERTNRYLRALSYWGVDWDQAIEELEILTYVTVGYRDVFPRLVQAHVIYGDTWVMQGEWCPAAVQYGQAVRLLYDAQVETKRLEAAQECQQATPTPIPGMITNTLPLGPIAGLNVGKLAYTSFNPTNGLYDLMVVNAANPIPIRYYSHVGQPSWRNDGALLIFKSWGEDGLITMPAGGGGASYVFGYSASYPSFSPDGSRIAFSTLAFGDDWEIYLLPLDGSNTPQYFARGNYPIWGPGGHIAYNGCTADRANCGIFVKNPDSADPATQLTGSLLDIPMSWSIDGFNVAYMSTYDGDWDVYNVNIAGGVTLLTDNAAVDGLPAWAPDGSGLAFISDRDGSWGIYIMRPDGTEQRKIIDLGEQHHNWTSERLSWGP